VRKPLNCFVMLALLPSFGGCTSHRYVHWQYNHEEATWLASQARMCRDAEITLTTGESLEGRCLTFWPDSLSWTPPTTDYPATHRTMALADIDGVRVVAGTHGGLGSHGRRPVHGGAVLVESDLWPRV
jgi:hypothetical protein